MRSATGQFSKRAGDEDPDETWRAGGWPATYPTRTVDEWRRIVAGWNAHLLEGAARPKIHAGVPARKVGTAGDR